MPTEIKLVVESELGDYRENDKSGVKSPAVRFDFQKLLVTNAEIRALIFKSRNDKELSELNGYFEEAIKAYTL